MIAVRPPEYWPRLETCALLDRVDHFVLADTFQYSRQSFQNRAQLRTPDGLQWITIPLHGRRHGRPICNIEIHGKHRWLRKHWRAFSYNYRATPFFEYFEDELRPMFEVEWERLADLTSHTMDLTCMLLKIETPLVRASDLDGAPSSLDAVLDAMDDHDLLVPSVSASVDGSLASSILEFDEAERRQNFEGFEKGTTALDLLFNYGPDALGMIRKQARVLDPS